LGDKASKIRLLKEKQGQTKAHSSAAVSAQLEELRAEKGVALEAQKMELEADKAAALASLRAELGSQMEAAVASARAEVECALKAHRAELVSQKKAWFVELTSFLESRLLQQHAREEVPLEEEESNAVMALRECKFRREIKDALVFVLCLSCFVCWQTFEVFLICVLTQLHHVVCICVCFLAAECGISESYLKHAHSYKFPLLPSLLMLYSGLLDCTGL
jgi:hypothetical protein